MDRRSAELLSRGRTEIRAIGEPCDPSCAMWFCCADSTPNGICTGFHLLNGESKKLLRRNMQENDLIYIENCARMIQNGCSEETKDVLTQEVHRYITPINNILKKEPTNRLGFRGMLNSISPSEPEEVQSKVVIRGFGRGFLGMLDEMSEGKRRSIAGVMPQIGIDKGSFRINKEEEPAVGFRAMLDKISKPTLEESTPEPIMRGFGRGFSGMIDELNRDRTFSETPATYTPVHRSVPLGFRGMLDDFTRGTEEEEAEQLQKVVPIFGFRRMLDDLSRKQERESEKAKAKIPNTGVRMMLDGQSPITTDERVPVDPIWRALYRELRAISNET